LHRLRFVDMEPLPTFSVKQTCLKHCGLARSRFPAKAGLNLEILTF